MWASRLLHLALPLALVLQGCRAHRATPAAVETADRIVVDKGAHAMTLYRAGQPLRTYQVSLGRGGPDAKERAGDNRLPEGVYRITAHIEHSAFYKSLRIGYPTAEQSATARSKGVDPGGDVMVHGLRYGLGWLGSLQRRADWTRGCIAVTDREMDEVWDLVPDGTVIEIRH